MDERRRWCGTQEVTVVTATTHKEGVGPSSQIEIQTARRPLSLHLVTLTPSVREDYVSQALKELLL